LLLANQASEDTGSTLRKSATKNKSREEGLTNSQSNENTNEIGDKRTEFAQQN
jgi:hypothetical protein